MRSALSRFSLLLLQVMRDGEVSDLSALPQAIATRRTEVNARVNARVSDLLGRLGKRREGTHDTWQTAARRLGGGLTYALNKSTGLSLLLITTRSGKNTYGSRGISTGMTWNFGPGS